MKYGKTIMYALISSAVCVILGMLSGIFSKQDGLLWYSTLIKPSFTPPNWIFAPVWTLLYIGMGIAFVSLWKHRKNQPALLSIFVVQLILNLMWSPLFFGAHRIDLALYDIVFLWISIGFFILRAYSRNRTASLLFIPYFLWVSFALILNYSLYSMNVY